MATPFIGQVTRFALDWQGSAPAGWIVCDGRLVDKSAYEALFSLIQYTYGGSGQQFAVPDLRGRAPVGAGQASGLSDYPLGQIAGVEQVTLTGAQYVGHSHIVPVSTAEASASIPDATMVLAQAQSATDPLPYTGAPMAYAANDGSQQLTLDPSVVTSVGGSSAVQPHENRQPFLALTYCIAFQGYYPTPP
jgi:microcystin-dependent protein